MNEQARRTTENEWPWKPRGGAYRHAASKGAIQELRAADDLLRAKGDVGPRDAQVWLRWCIAIQEEHEGVAGVVNVK